MNMDMEIDVDIDLSGKQMTIRAIFNNWEQLYLRAKPKKKNPYIFRQKKKHTKQTKIYSSSGKELYQGTFPDIWGFFQ